jgi:Tfp pilus assembly protein PilO
VSTTRRTLLVTAGAVAVLALLWFAFLWRPQSGRLAAAHEREAAAAAENAQLDLELSRLRAASADRADLLVDQGRLRSAIPDEPALAEFILDANDVASTAGVDWLSVTPSRPVPAEGGRPATISVDVGVDGGYFQVLDYLDRLGAMDRIVVIDSINASTGGDGGATPRLSVTLTARLFTTAAATGGGPDPVEGEPAPEAVPVAAGQDAPEPGAEPPADPQQPEDAEQLSLGAVGNRP